MDERGVCHEVNIFIFNYLFIGMWACIECIELWDFYSLLFLDP